MKPIIVAILLTLSLVGCSGGSSSSPPSNGETLIGVKSIPDCINYVLDAIQTRGFWEEYETQQVNSFVIIERVWWWSQGFAIENVQDNRLRTCTLTEFRFNPIL